MSTVEDFREIYQYNWRVLRDYCDALSKLPPAALVKDREATYHSMKNIFFHVLTVHDGWLNLTAQGRSADPKIREVDEFDDIKTMPPLQAYMEKVIAMEELFLKSLKASDLDRKIQPSWKKRAHALRDALMQVTLEQAHHFGELIALFWQQDVEPPEMTWVDIHMAISGELRPS